MGYLESLETRTGLATMSEHNTFVGEHFEDLCLEMNVGLKGWVVAQSEGWPSMHKALGFIKYHINQAW